VAEISGEERHASEKVVKESVAKKKCNREGSKLISGGEKHAKKL
jgi:hypothetical protein